MTTATIPEQQAAYGERKESFLAANRKLPLWPAAISIAGTWVWAPALFTSAEVSFNWGWEGLAWFTIPNVLIIMIFGWFAAKLRSRRPHGFTLTEYMRQTYSKRVQVVYLGQVSLLAMFSFSVQLLAGAGVLAMITGWSYPLITLVIAAATVFYSWFGGLKASVTVDVIQIALAVIVLFTFTPMVVNAVGWDTIVAGMDSSHVDSVSLMLGFGIPTVIGLASGPFADQAFWQRSFATKIGSVRRSFTIGALIFAIVPFGMAILGFAGAGSSLNVENTQMANVAAVQEFLPGWALVPFILMLVFALGSTMDNGLISNSTLAGHDLTRGGNPITRGRIAMIITAVIGLAIANIPGITVIHLALGYQLFRASTMTPTIITLLTEKRMPSERGMFWGVVLSTVIGWPIFFIGSIIPGQEVWVAIGSVLVVIISTALVLASRPRKHQPDNSPINTPTVPHTTA